jgi:hypothetical protein
LELSSTFLKSLNGVADDPGLFDINAAFFLLKPEYVVDMVCSGDLYKGM